ncbi:thioesterase [Sandarakinorhabdus cyanobacteriorum]|uniref:Thioesterase n=1 Tax=Sandarakinorhabdus cyanobacteriorum TaxID=1981098 RepID=A0A255YVK2_9SPHN|nr:PaaI family thioesterase [Sandarakinorhabdus cyanobacteriorum]OYQ33232.1 thioesterase [Sandarakinorhabdus cyanobacteriorum]
MNQPPDTGPPGSLPDSLAQRRIVRFDPGHAVIEYEVLPAMCHSGGVAQGGFVSGWIDAAMAHAVMAQHGFDRVPISLELKVSFFAPANPGRVLAEAWIEKAGGRTIFAEGRLTTPEGKVLAKASSTITLIDAAKVRATMV